MRPFYARRYAHSNTHTHYDTNPYCYSYPKAWYYSNSDTKAHSYSFSNAYA